MAIKYYSGINISGNIVPSADSTYNLGGPAFYFANVYADNLHGDGSNITNIGAAESALTLTVTVKNKSGGSLAKGTVVHAAPSANPPSGNIIEVIAADYDTAANMPGLGVLNETLANDAEGEAIMFGAVSGIDTSSFLVGTELYVGNNGALTGTKPTATNQLIQKIAVVIKSHATNGLIKVFGAGRTNDVPNLLTRDITIDDDVQLKIGAGNDLRLFHNTANTTSYIDAYVGTLIIRNNADDQDIIISSDNGSGGTTQYFRADGGNGSVVLYHYGNRKFETTSTGSKVSGDLEVTGNFTVSGTTTFIDTTHLNIGDNIITLNADLPGTSAPTENAGISVYRGSSSSVSFVWDETNDRWTVGSESLTAATFIGNLTGDVTGNLTGDVTGNADTATWADTVDVNANDTFNGTYSLVWHDGDTLYRSSWLNVNGSTDTLNAPNIGTGDVTLSGDLRGSEATSLIKDFVASNDYENQAFYNPDTFNAYAGADKWATITLTNVYNSDRTTARTDLGSSPFNYGGNASNYYFNANEDEMVIEIDHTSEPLKYGAVVGIQWTTTSWRAKRVKIEGYNGTAWTTGLDVTNNTEATALCKLSLGSTGVQKLRITLGDPVNTTGGYMRISKIFGYDYQGVGSYDANHTGTYYIEKYRDNSHYSNIYPETDSTYSLGTNTKRYADVYSDDFVGTNAYLTNITSSGNSNIYIQPNGTGNIYFGTSGNGNTIYHYSKNDDGVYTIFDHTTTQSRFNTTGTAGFRFENDVLVNGDVNAVGASFTNPVTIYDLTATENPRLSLGRQAAESINFDVGDRDAIIYHRQDETDGVHTMQFAIDSGNSEKRFIWYTRAANATSPVELMHLDDNGLDVSGNVVIGGTLEVSGTIDLSNANLDIGQADIVFDIDSSTAGARGLVWDFDGDGNGVSSYIGYIRAGGTAGERMDFNMNAEGSVTGNSTIYKFMNGGSEVMSIGANGNVVTQGYFTSNGYIQSYGTLYTRSDLRVLNAAGTGWTVWGTRNNGTYDLSVGSVTASSFIKSGGTSSQFLKADGSVDSNTYVLSSHTHDDRYYTETESDAKFAPVKRATVTISKDSYTRVARVEGDNLASTIRMTVHGTTGNIVVNCLSDISVNHSGDIIVHSQAGNYSSLDIKIISDNNEDFDIYLQYTGSSNAGTSFGARIEIFPLNNETITYSPTATAYSGTTFIHTATPGQIKWGQSGQTPNIYLGSNKVYHAGNDGSGSGLDADTLDGLNSTDFVRIGEPLFSSNTSDDTTGPIEFIRASGSGWDDYIIKHGSSKGMFSKQGVGWHNHTDSSFHVFSSSWTANFGVNSDGTSVSRSSSRAPIFYDSDNTSYYIDAAGGSLLSTLVLAGSQTRGSYDTASQYHTGADNLILKGNSSGISTIFFESEKDGTNINHPSDFGFIQFHPYGTGTSGEANELIIGVSNDSDDHVVLNAPNANGLKFRVGSSATDYTVWHSGNDGSGSGLDADTVDGLQASQFLRSDADDVVSAGVTYTWNDTDTHGLQFTNSSYSKSLYIGGWSASNSSGISRIRNSNDNLHLDSGSAGVMLLNHYSGGNVGMNNGGGYTYSYTSMRAPVFYDYNDTSYYVDPANSNLSVKVYGEICNSNVYEGNLQPGALNIGRTDYNYRWEGTSWASDVRVGILANCSDHWEFAVHDSGESVESVFYYNSGDNMIYMGRDLGWGTTPIVHVNSSRAPIFYDYNNTGYYTDPASTSNLNNLRVVTVNGQDTWEGTITINGSSNTYYPVGWYGGEQTQVVEIEVFRNYSETAPNDWNTSTHKGSLVCKIRTNFGGWGGAQYDWALEEFRETYSTQLAWAGHFANSRAFGLKLRGGGAIYHVRIKGRSVAPTVTLGTWDPGGNSTGISSTTSVDSTLLNRRNHIRGNYLYSYDSAVLHEGSTSQTKSGTLQSTVDFRAPIFYDRNNTGYYLHPDSTSVLNGLNVSGYADFQGDAAIGGGNGYGYLKGYTSNWNHFICVRGSVSGAKTSPTISGAHQTTFIEYAENNSTTGWFFKSSSSTNYEEVARITRDYASFTQARAPIFYDTNNTNYYIDPNSTSVFQKLRVNDATSGWSLILGASDTSRVQNDNARHGLVVNASYYPHIDVNATATSDVNPTHGPVISMTSKLGSGYRRWGMGIAQYNANELSFGYYDNQTNPHYGVGIGWASPAKMWIDTSGHLYSTGSMRSPIFYDSNNTSYYTDPAGESILKRVRCGTSTSDNNGTVSLSLNDGSLHFRSVTDYNHKMWYYDGLNFSTNPSHGHIRFWADSSQRNASTGGSYLRFDVDCQNATATVHGTFYSTGDIVAYSSDKRLKTNIKPISDPIEKIKKISGVTYDWVDDIEEKGFNPRVKKDDIGVIAQEIEEVLPQVTAPAPFDHEMNDEIGELVSKSGEGYKTVQYEKLVPLLIEAIKEQQKQIDELKKLINP